MLSQPNYPSSCQHPWFLGFMWFWERNAVFSLNRASWSGSGLQRVPVEGFLNKTKLVSLRATPCSRCMDLICNLLSSPLWTQLCPHSSCVGHSQSHCGTLPMLGAALQCLPLCIGGSHPLVPHFAFVSFALVHTKWAKMHFTGSQGHRRFCVGRDI